MFKYQYINYYTRREHSGLMPDKIALTWNIWDNRLSDMWAEVIKRKLAQEDITPRDYSAHNSFPALQNKYELFDKISNDIKIAREVNPNIEWPDNINIITQQHLNYLHERFHEAQEFTLSNKEIRARITLEKLEEIRSAFNKINHNIHSLENAIEFESRTDKFKKERQNYHVINFGLYDGNLRLPLDDSLRIEHFREKDLPIYKPVQLWLGYATVGKNMLHCVINDDADVVRDNMIRPQLDIGGETLAIVYNGNGWDLTNEDNNLRFANYHKQLEAFMQRHDLYSYVDHKLVIHQYCKQPSLGVIADEHDSWTEKDYYTLFNDYKLTSVELREL